MGITLKLSWRNVFRNKRRTVITGAAIALGLAALIFVDGLFIGMARSMIASATSTFTGEGQIHRRGFLDTRDAADVVADAPAVLAALARDPRVKASAARTLCPAMVTSPSGVEPVLLTGIDPAAERGVSRIDDALAEGAFFTGDGPQDLVIGARLAELLEIGLGDRVVVTVSQAGSGALSQDLFRVSGVYRFDVPDLDGGLAFVRLPKARAMLGLPADAVHEIALAFRDPRLSGNVDDPFWAEGSRGGNEAIGWTRLFPALTDISRLTHLSSLIQGVILFAVIALGIVNTLFMSIYERMFELGVLRAVGTRPRGIRRLVVGEAGALALLSAGLGTALGLLAGLVASRVGIDYRGLEYGGATIHELIYPVLELRQFVLYPLSVVAFTLLVGLYPAAYAARMSVAGAMKRAL